jgi:hypothetical protein
VATLLVTKALGRTWSSWLTVAPTAALALLPSAVTAWPGGQMSWRVWFVLLVAGAVLGVGVRLHLAGAVYPAIAAIAAVVGPVLFRLTQDLPAWVPLTIVGAALLILGARLEDVRRQGRHFSSWNHLLH